MPTKIKNDNKRYKVDGNSVSHILWIAIAAAVISVVGLAIFEAVKAKGTETSTLITNSKGYIESGGTMPISGNAGH